MKLLFLCLTVNKINICFKRQGYVKRQMGEMLR